MGETWSNEPVICSICLEELGNESIADLECGHKLHLHCLMRFLNGTENPPKFLKCPLCRKEYKDIKPCQKNHEQPIRILEPQRLGELVAISRNISRNYPAHGNFEYY